MTVVGFNFRKITAEKMLNGPSGKINITNNVSVKKVEEASIPVGAGKQKTLRFTYEFITKYEPSLGTILIEGDVLFLADEDHIEKTLKDWKKNKQINKDTLTPILNMILSKCSVKGLLISQDLNLPSPLQLPRVTVK